MTQPPAPDHPDVPAGGVRTVTIDAERDGQRIDNFLLGVLKGAPRSLVYKIIRSGQVRVNGGRVRAERKLEAGDEVRVPPVRLEAPGGQGTPARGLLQALDAGIVYEDDRLLALNKPSGVASHGGSGIAFGAIETLRALRPNQSLELVHRLDRDTSGVLLVAKKRAALTELQALMREDSAALGAGRAGGGSSGGLRKRYLALLLGRLPDGVMSVDAPLHVGLRQGGERHVQALPRGSAPGGTIGKESLSHFRVLERRGGHSYCEVRIETGRTHQIRAHARHIGHAVAGDDKYGDPDANRRLRDKAGLRRLFLHAASIEFALDDGRVPYLIQAPLAPDLLAVLDRLG